MEKGGRDAGDELSLGRGPINCADAAPGEISAGASGRTGHRSEERHVTPPLPLRRATVVQWFNRRNARPAPTQSY